MRLLFTFFVVALVGAANQLHAGILVDANVTNEVIFGSGNANGAFTVDRNASGVELGLRAKLRHNAFGLPENTFNSNGDGTYDFAAIVAPTQSSPTAVWSFEWSINSNWTGNSGYNLNDLTYSLAMTSTTGAYIEELDRINGPNPFGDIYWDHAIGDSGTGNGAGVTAADETEYASLINSNTLAQNSWKPHWFAIGFDPTDVGQYFFTLSAYDGGVKVASTSMTVNAVPEPTSFLMFGAVLGLGLTPRRRRRK